MKTVQPFIDLGFYIVPLDGVIVREKNGKKTIPPFRGNWKELYWDEPYNPLHADPPEAPALTGAVITGEKSGVVSIDCDDNATYDLFCALHPTYKFHFVSKDKPEGGGSIIYKLSNGLQDIKSFRIHSKGMQLDFQTDGLLQFLPTSGNKTKVEWLVEEFEDMPLLEDPPATVVTQIKALYELSTLSRAVKTADGRITNRAVANHYKHLAPFVESFLKTGKFIPELFRILTPANGGFRDLPQYIEEKTLHPDNVPEGMGNAYLTSVAGVLVCDESISAQLFKDMMKAINALWSKPYPKEKLDRLIKYQLSREEWAYKEDWREGINLILTEYGTLVSVYYDPLTRIYYVLDDKLGMSTFDSVDKIPKHLNSIVDGKRKYTTVELYDYLTQKQTIFTPLEPHGDLPPADDSTTLARNNLFQRSRAYDILLHPERYEEEFSGKMPETTLAYFAHLMPDVDVREYVLRFVLTKLITLSFSEVILYFLGISGAGKNLFVEWLNVFTENCAVNTKSADYKMVVEVELENFLAKYNLWILNALFANLDEYGEKTANSIDDKRVLATLKSFTGKEDIQLRTMNNDPVPAKHKCTFILTANENKLSPDLEDRRLVIIETPDRLEDATFVKFHGGKSEAIKRLFEEQELWAYYWTQHFEPLSATEYRTPPMTKTKERLIMRHLPPSKKIIAIIETQHARNMIELCEDCGLIEELAEDAVYGAVSKQLLIDVFAVMTDGTAARKALLDRALRDSHIQVVKMRLGSRNTYATPFPALKEWASKHKMNNGILLHKGEGEEDEF